MLNNKISNILRTKCKVLFLDIIERSHKKTKKKCPGPKWLRAFDTQQRIRKTNALN